VRISFHSVVPVRGAGGARALASSSTGKPTILTFPWMSAVPTGKYLDGIYNWATTASFHVLSRLLFTIVPSFGAYLKHN